MNTLSVTLQENRIFPPSQKFISHHPIPLEQIQKWRKLARDNRLQYWKEASFRHF
jgi:hypothetical protein